MQRNTVCLSNGNGRSFRKIFDDSILQDYGCIVIFSCKFSAVT